VYNKSTDLLYRQPKSSKTHFIDVSDKAFWRGFLVWPVARCLQLGRSWEGDRPPWRARGNKLEAIGYLRTSAAPNVRDCKDSERRQRLTIERHACAAGFVIVDWFYDAAVSGADPVEARPGFAAMLARIAGNGVRTIIVETAAALLATSWCKRSDLPCFATWALH
jgi:Resolvase, N terminal domain